MFNREVDFLIIGSGFAGAATAFHLSRRAPGRIVIAEREKTPGAHASGRNASLLVQSVEEPAIRRLAAESRLAYCRHGEEVGFRQLGSVYLGTHDQLESMREPSLVPTHYLEPAEVGARVPLLEDHPFEAALETPGDGSLDAWALLSFYLAGARARGVEVVFDCEVLEISGSPPLRVRTSRGTLTAGCVVNAAGAWAAQVAARAGVVGPSLEAKKRHLFILDGVAPLNPAWPLVWDFGPGFYFRPESGGLMFSLCDEEPSASLAETVSPGISEQLAEFVFEHQLAPLEEARIRSVWSCFRTAATDHRFVIGRDPHRGGFFWVAGLWGYGVGCSWSVGRLAADLLLGGARQSPFDPARFGGDRA